MKTTNIFYRALCLVLMALCSVCGFAQSEFGKVSPQTADFIRQGNIPVSLYTGQVNVSIPLYHIKDRDFDIPIALNYAGDGLKPNRRHGWAGLNWSVSGAGAVSREIYGAPDDHNEWYDSYPDIEDTSSPSMATMGYYRALSVKSYNADDLYNFDVTLDCDDYECHLPYVNNCFYDGTPDLFLFSMPGHSGRFVSCANRILEQPICPNSYKFSLAGLTAQVHGSAVKASQITVTASNGYVYTFGSLTDTNSLEYSFGFHPTTDYDSNNAYKRPRINAWHLTKITAPNGRTVKFNYAAATESTLSPFMKSDCPRTSSGSNTPSTTDDFSYSATRTVLLESIEIEDTGVKVEFLNGLENCRAFYSYGSVGNKYNALGYQLNGIRVKQDGTTVYTCSLGYENRNHLRFLKTVTATDGGVYTLEYNHPASYPEPTIPDVDTYGYWTGTGSTAYSLLNKVSYPTDGDTSFGYERHTYNRAVKRFADASEYSYNLVDSIGTLNAFRIRQVTSTPAGNGTAETKEYTYPLWSDSSKDSGTLLRTRTFLYMDGYEVAQTTTRTDDYNIEEPVIGYSSVQEKNADGAYTEYVFSDYQTCPDTQDANFHWHSSAQTSGILQAYSTASLMTSRWDQRGKLVTERTYDSSGNRKRQVRYSYRLLGSTFQPVYTELLEHHSPYTTSVANVTGGLVADRITMQEYPLIMEEAIDTQDNGNMTTTRLFYRNRKNLLSKVEERTSARDTLKTLYSYAMDNNAWIGTVWSTMQLKHMTDTPVSEQQMLNGETAETRRTTFKSIGNGDVVPDTVYVRKGNGAEKMEVCYPVYDAYSNPVHVVYGNGTEEVLVWGYAGRYLAARIEGAGYDMVETALGTAPEEVTDNAGYMDMLNELRTSLPDAHVTTYTYSPLVGVTEVTAPNNEKTTYTYDSMNRLYQVKDHTGNVVEQYNYNYKQ